MIRFSRLFCAFTLISILSTLAASAGTEETKSRLTRVETKKVCMINNAVFEKDQIAVEVERKTYYGCCEMCKERLKNDSDSRLAIDPVSGKKVDKAIALIAASAEGKAFYFENEENLKRYNAEVK